MPNRIVAFLGGSLIKNPPSSVGGVDPHPGSGRFPGEANGNPLQYSCLENSMDKGGWWTTVHGVAKRIGHRLVTKQQKSNTKTEIVPDKK